MAKLFIELDMFNFNQNIILYDGDKDPVFLARVPVEKVSEIAIGHIDECNIDEIEIDGNRNFAQRVVSDLQNDLKTRYSNRNVRIKINGEVLN